MMELSVFRYRFPLVKPFKTAAGSFTKREGLIFILERSGIRAFGEAAPLPGFSRESLDEVLAELEQERDHIYELIRNGSENPSLDVSIPTGTLAPSMAFALDTLLHDYRAKKTRQPLRNMLFEKPMTSIPVNAALGAESFADLLDRVQTLWNEGFRTFKLKVGVDFERELERIGQLREGFAGIRIRLDANQSWEFDEAKTNLSRLDTDDIDIEYCEEPLRKPDVEKLLELQNTVTVPLALDECLHQSETYEPFIRQKAGRVIIIKPMVFGGLQRIYHVCRLAEDHDYLPVFTTSLESGIGRMMTANLASGLGSSRFAHGLATGNLFNMDVWRDQAYIDSGQFILPDGYGLDQAGRPENQDLALEPIFF